MLQKVRIYRTVREVVELVVDFRSSKTGDLGQLYDAAVLSGCIPRTEIRYAAEKQYGFSPGIEPPTVIVDERGAAIPSPEFTGTFSEHGRGKPRS